MAPRPAKRQRRSTIALSDDNDADSEPPSSKHAKASFQREITLDGRTSTTVSPIKSTKTRSAAKRAAASSSPISSPEKTRKNTRVKDEPVKNKSLHNFFGKASEEQRWRKKSQTPDLEVENSAELSDAIEDDDLSDETLQELGLKIDKSSNPLERRNPTLLSSSRNHKERTNEGSLPSSQRFVKPAVPTRNSTTATNADRAEGEGHAPWADRYGPTNLEELMVHKKKVTDVQSWLQGKIDGRNNQKLLVLKGPAGSGKTTTVSLLAKAMGLQVVSWHNPAVSELGANNSISAQFDEFLSRGGQFGSLAFDHDISAGQAPEGAIGNQILVIEEFPATMTRSSSALHSFRSVISRFLARAKAAPAIALRGQQSSNDVSPPVVIIISETLLSSSTALADSFTAHRLLGPEILNHSFVTAMDFNPVAATLMTKALDLVVKKEARDSRRRRTPGPGVIARLAEIGDIRSAVNSLEFLCLKGDNISEWSGTVAAKVKRTSKDNVALTETEKNSLELVSQRETTLDMFHATGKIVYNKREDPRVLDTRAEPPPKPPDHLMHLYTPKVSQVDIEALLSETGTDIQTFISTVHENYILSCSGDNFEVNFDGCSDILSVSDILNPECRPNRRGNTSNPNAGIIQSNFQAGSSDTLRQDEISFNVATRGLLSNLPFPVNRAGAAIPGGKRGDEFKMFYPASLRLWKPIEEMHGLLEMFVYGDGIAPSRPATSAADGPISDGGVATWQSRNVAENSMSMTTATTTAIKSEPPDQDIRYPTLVDLGNDQGSPPPPTIHAKDTLTLELLPYRTRILSARHEDTSSLEKITKFKPTSYLSTTEENPEDDDDMMATSTGVAALPRATAAGPKTTSGRNGPPNLEAPSVGVEKMYISDDDIEDD
jgi:cell cycle checkpoint protein